MTSTASLYTKYSKDSAPRSLRLSFPAIDYAPLLNISVYFRFGFVFLRTHSTNIENWSTTISLVFFLKILNGKFHDLNVFSQKKIVRTLFLVLNCCWKIPVGFSFLMHLAILQVSLVIDSLAIKIEWKIRFLTTPQSAPEQKKQNPISKISLLNPFYIQFYISVHFHKQPCPNCQYKKSATMLIVARLNPSYR